MAQAYTPEEKKQRIEERAAAALRPREAKDGSTRKKKGIFNGTGQKLTVGNQIPGYHLYIMNDTRGRIQEAIEGGYEFVTPEEVGGVVEKVTSTNTDVGSRVRYSVGTDESGEPLYAFLMKIREEWYQEDQADLQGRSDYVDDVIRSGKNVKDGTSAEGFYEPRGTKIQYKS